MSQPARLEETPCLFEELGSLTLLSNLGVQFGRHQRVAAAFEHRGGFLFFFRPEVDVRRLKKRFALLVALRGGEQIAYRLEELGRPEVVPTF